ncbi:hypothetical protein HK097_004186 [Rhizophlyctis rosea]|uniref:DUF6604 domain-containing protein n=1 Tax=Rhizophlyctis rosea TaxID=64517 RepID=A0AAD5SFP3_9FUNG|nr:hypothetical protein HK097_004186 [Rhizophlyctis rosea]
MWRLEVEEREKEEGELSDSDSERELFEPLERKKVVRALTERESAAVREERAAEVKFEAWCLYEDLRKLRKFLQGLWKKYYRRPVLRRGLHPDEGIPQLH